MTMIPIHVGAGLVALVAGAVALGAAKGRTLHRRSGALFVGTMLLMSLSGTAMAVLGPVMPSINVTAGVLTAYLVLTGLATVRPPRAGARSLDVTALLVAVAVGVSSTGFGVQALATGNGYRGEIPAFPYLPFGAVGLIAAFGDLRVVRGGSPRGARRLARHLWRMCFALFIATMSFFLGQADELPQAVRIPVLLATPVVAVLLAMVYWLLKVRRRTISYTDASPLDIASLPELSRTGTP